jgi:hypothetical protein
MTQARTAESVSSALIKMIGQFSDLRIKRLIVGATKSSIRIENINFRLFDENTDDDWFFACSMAR